MADLDHAPTFGSLLRRHRLAAGLTQEMLAHRSGVAKRTLQDLEREIVRPRRETARRLIAALRPSADVRALFEAATSAPRNGDRRLVEHHGEATSMATSTRQIPIRLTSFVGRERELAELAHLLKTCRLLTLTGPGGCGKTRLAAELVDHIAPAYPDGVFMVPLTAIADPHRVVSGVSETLGVRESTDEPLLETLKRSIGGRALLLLLDNFEHLLPAGPMLSDLLGACPHLTALVTSREVLRLQGEQAYPVSPLSLPEREASVTDGSDDVVAAVGASEAVRLFVDRARNARPDFQLDAASASTVADICARLDGLPLAIELAAARVRMLSPQVLLVRLERRLPLLTGGARDLPERQRTLRDTIAWSYGLLSESERRLFRRLAIFVGGCTFDAAEAVCDIDGDLGLDILDGIAALIDKSLMHQEDGSEGEPRFGMLETIREYGLEALEAVGETAKLRRRHLTYFVDRSEQVESDLFGPLAAVTVRRQLADHDNVRAALAWSLSAPMPDSAEAGLRLASSFTDLWRRSWLSLTFGENPGGGRYDLA